MEEENEKENFINNPYRRHAAVCIDRLRIWRRAGYGAEHGAKHGAKHGAEFSARVSAGGIVHWRICRRVILKTRDTG